MVRGVMTTNEQDLSTFFAERASKYREYVEGCIALADEVMRAFQSHLGPHAKLVHQALKPSKGQTQISPNGLLQESGFTVFGFAVEFEAARMPPHVVSFFVSVGKIIGKKGKPDEWQVGYEKDSVTVPNGRAGQELEPLFAHLVSALEAGIVSTYPTEASHQAARDMPGSPDAKESV
jgi:hypothetical protein